MVRDNGPATSIAFASAINGDGVIVGWDRNGGFVYQNGVITALDAAIPPNSGYHIINATGVNGNGAIVGHATKGFGGPTCGVLLTPTGHLAVSDNSLRRSQRKKLARRSPLR
jgi:hypothetical protein